MAKRNKFVTADTHFGHANILKFSAATRPWNSADEMDEALINAWNNKVSPDDIVYHLGDFAMCGFQKAMSIAEQLNGEIVLIRGNHDQIFRKDQNIQKALSSGKFSSIVDYHEIRLPDEANRPQTIVMSHYAMRVWNKSHYGSYMLFGHSHGSLKGEGRSVDVGIDSSEMDSEGAPFAIEDVIAFLYNKCCI